MASCSSALSSICFWTFFITSSFSATAAFAVFSASDSLACRSAIRTSRAAHVATLVSLSAASNSCIRVFSRSTDSNNCARPKSPVVNSASRSPVSSDTRCCARISSTAVVSCSFAHCCSFSCCSFSASAARLRSICSCPTRRFTAASSAVFSTRSCTASTSALFDDSNRLS